MLFLCALKLRAESVPISSTYFRLPHASRNNLHDLCVMLTDKFIWTVLISVTYIQCPFVMLFYLQGQATIGQ